MTSPGRIALVGNKTDWRTVTPDGVQVILDLGSVAVAVPPPAVFFGLFTEDPAQWEAVKMAAASFNARPNYKVRPCFIQDGDGPFPDDVLATMPRWGLPLKELYWYENEPVLADATARWYVEAIDLAQRWKYDMGAIIQAYTMSIRTVEQVQAVAVAGVKHLNDRGARWKLALNFAWKDPRGGDIPELAALQTQICAGSPGWPAFEPIPPIPPPPVTKPSIIALC